MARDTFPLSTRSWCDGPEGIELKNVKGWIGFSSSAFLPRFVVSLRAAAATAARKTSGVGIVELVSGFFVEVAAGL